MALIKEIVLENGITVKYHRIVSVMNITNHETIIEVASYINKAKREEEKKALNENKAMNVYIFTNRISVPYRQTMDVDEAYEYLKMEEDFEDAKDD